MNSRTQLRTKLLARLAVFEAASGALPGIAQQNQRNAFVEQIVDSVRRVEFVHRLTEADLSPARASPHSTIFDPIRGAIIHEKADETDEAWWLTFLAIHCGRHLVDGWELCRRIYAGDGPGKEWTWARISENPKALSAWLDAKNTAWLAAGTRPRFGNHRKYESLAEDSKTGSGQTVRTYVEWVLRWGDHAAMLEDVLAKTGQDEHSAFDQIYDSMSAVNRFGRLARFDFLCMVNKIGLASISPSHPYIDNASGPKSGAKLLMGQQPGKFNKPMSKLARALKVDMQVMEDALCNWSKSPAGYKAFRG